MGDTEGAEAIAARMAALSPLSGRFGSVRVGNLGAGVLGMAPINGSVSEIYLSASLAARGSTEKMYEVLIHEQRHTNQVQLQSGNGKAVLITPTTTVLDDVVMYEGDTETHQSKETGERDDRPAAVYQEGFDIFKELSGHSERLNQVMTQTGRLEDLQNDIWEEQLRAGTLDIEQVQDQSNETGYEISEHIVTIQNRKWVMLVESGELTREAVEAASQRVGIDLQHEAVQRINDIQAETRDLYENGPESVRAHNLN